MAEVKIFQREGFDRIVIDPVASGEITKTSAQLSIPYASSVSAEAITTTARSVAGVQKEGNALLLTLNDAVTETRHFQIGSRVVLDIFIDPDRVSTTAEKQAQPVQKQAVEEKSAPTPPDPVKTPEEKDITEVQEDAPPLSVAETLPDLADPTIITISSTVDFGLAVFQRHNRLFLIADQADIAVPPQLSGQGAAKKWPLREVEVGGGKGWMIPLPQGAYVRPEGKGLIWRVIVSDSNPGLSTSDIRRRMTDPANPQVDLIMPAVAKMLRVTDPDYKDDLAVITVKQATSRIHRPYDFVDFDILPAVVGAVVKPESDGIKLKAATQFVTISKAGGLTLAKEPQDDIVAAYLDNTGALRRDQDANLVQTTLDRIYYFEDWGIKSKPHAYNQKRAELDKFLALAPRENKLGIVLTMTKLTLSQGLGPEALGYLSLAEGLNPQINQSAEYKGLRGAAHYLAGQYDEALRYFSDSQLGQVSEALLWKAASHAALGNEDAVLESYQGNAVLSSVYPYDIKRHVIAPIATAMLNKNDAAAAGDLIALLETDVVNQSQEARATLAYLKGRAQAITGSDDAGIDSLYTASLADKLGPYGIRSELLLVKDELAREVIEKSEGIRRLERLRFAWRGDHLEYEIQKSLGELYIDNKEPRKGLNILKRAARNAQSAQERRSIVRIMAEAYKSIFMDENFDDLDPMIAITVYDEFKELTPVGPEGNALIDRVAEKLMGINLFSRAADVLTDKMNRLREGENAIRSGLKVATIQLLDRDPKATLKTLEKVDAMILPYDGTNKPELNEKIVLLKARALSDAGQPQQALFIMEGLGDSDDVIRLRIDTAWRSGQWVAVTDNLSKLLARQDITASAPPTAEQTQLILNQAVALSLSDQYDALQRFANQYDLVMKQTPSYKTFQLVTRPQNISNLADRQTLLDVTSEVDLFKGFLDNLKDE